LAKGQEYKEKLKRKRESGAVFEIKVGSPG
jgi:hypothetical protein